MKYISLVLMTLLFTSTAFSAGDKCDRALASANKKMTQVTDGQEAVNLGWKAFQACIAVSTAKYARIDNSAPAIIGDDADVNSDEPVIVEDPAPTLTDKGMKIELVAGTSMFLCDKGPGNEMDSGICYLKLANLIQSLMK